MGSIALKTGFSATTGLSFRERVLSDVLVSRPEQPQFFCDGVVGHFFAGRFRPKPPAKLLENHFPDFQRWQRLD
jgi:hypothetical protein